MFYVTIRGNFERFETFPKQIFWEKKTFVSKKTRVPFLSWNMDHVHTKLPNQKPILRQTEWWDQNGPITKNGVLSGTTFFRKFCFSWRTSYKEVTWCTNYPNVHICTFCKRWSFFDGAFFLWVSLSECSRDVK